MKNYKIALLAGDGIGPEIMAEAVKIFRLVEERNDVTFTLIEADFGAAAYFKCGHPFPDETKAICDAAQQVPSSEFQAMADKIEAIAGVVGKTISRG